MAVYKKPAAKKPAAGGKKPLPPFIQAAIDKKNKKKK